MGQIELWPRRCTCLLEDRRLLTYLFSLFFIPFYCIICLVPKDGRFYFLFFFFEHGIYAALHIVFSFLVWGGSPTWDNRLGGSPRGAIVYNLLQRVVVLFLFFFILCRLYYYPIITDWHNIHKKSKIEIYIVALHHYCLSPLLYTTPLIFRTYQHLGLNLCYNLRTSPLARLLISGELRHAPQMLHITILGAPDL